MQLNDLDNGPERWPQEERGPARPPSYALWLVYLYLKPRRFFSFFIDNHLPVITALCAWMLGVVSAHDRMETRAVNGGNMLPLVDSWPAYLSFIGVTGLVSAVLFFYIGAWWYRVRLRWSGAQSPDRRVARRVYLYASTVAAFPGACALAMDAMAFPRPIDAMLAYAGWAELLPVAFLAWSVVTSYVGVRTVFGVSGWRPILWFLVLPMLIYGAVMGIVAAVMILGLYAPAPNTSSPIVQAQGAVSFEHPGNWAVDQADPAYDADLYLPIILPQDAHLEVIAYRTDLTAKEEIERTRADWQEAYGAVSLRGPMSDWGGRAGEGVEFTVTDAGESFVARVFIIEAAPGVMLEVRAFFFEEDRDTLRPGFEQVVRSLRIDQSRLPALDDPETEGPESGADEPN